MSSENPSQLDPGLVMVWTLDKFGITRPTSNFLDYKSHLFVCDCLIFKIHNIGRR